MAEVFVWQYFSWGLRQYILFCPHVTHIQLLPREQMAGADPDDIVGIPPPAWLTGHSAFQYATES